MTEPYTNSTAEVLADPDFDYREVLNDSGNPGYVNRVMVGTATTGLVRIEWHAAMVGAVVPHNWAMVKMTQQIPQYIPLRYQVDDAQNIMVKIAIERDFEWLILLEHDVIIPHWFWLSINKYIREPVCPVVSGLYFTRSHPSEPLLYRGRGVSNYMDWEMGEKVWVDGVPTGALLIHVGLLKEMWKDAEEYVPKGYTEKTRQVFRTPRDIWFDEENSQINSYAGTSDLDWCTRVIEGDYIPKAGWDKFWGRLPDKRYPFLIDTTIFCNHIDKGGTQFPLNWPELKAYAEYVTAEEMKKPTVTIPELPEEERE